MGVDNTHEPDHPDLPEPDVEKARPVVIGEQQGRVDYAANMFDAETYPGLTAEEAGLPEGSAELKAAQLEHNKDWISRMKEEGRLVIDTGPAEWRNEYPEATRPSDWPEAPYEAELSTIENYPNVVRPWADMTEAPNFPWKYDPSSYHEGYLHRDEGTPTTDAAAGLTRDPAVADSPESAELSDTRSSDTSSALARDEGHALPATAGPSEELTDDQGGIDRGQGDWETATSLPPNATIDAGNYQFGTDDLGRVVQAYGITLENSKAARQRKDAGLVRDTIPSGFDDQAGHLIAARFGGPGDYWNMVAQDRDLNLGEWRKIENQWNEALKNGPVEVDIAMSYHEDDLRPFAFHVEYTMTRDDGEIETVRKDILNAPREAKDNLNPD